VVETTAKRTDSATIRGYLAERERARTRGVDRGRAARVLRRVSPYELRQWAKLNGTTLLVPVSKFRMRALLRSNRELRLHLGSGANRIPEWVNVDILGMHPDVHWDLRRGIPLPANSVRAVFLEHVLEHFTFSDVLGTLEECHRVLAPGGIVRVGVPDFGHYMESYVGDGRFIEERRPGRPTALLAVAEVALLHGHRSVWDGRTLERVLEEAGFVDVDRRAFGESALDPAPDSAWREAETVYAEGRKP
jgi:predicted SAM-dependent methyltransferase